MSTQRTSSKSDEQHPAGDQDSCPHCGRGFQFVREEEPLEPRSTVFACEAHDVYGDGDCPGTILRVYEDGHVSRHVYGRGILRG